MVDDRNGGKCKTYLFCLKKFIKEVAAEKSRGKSCFVKVFFIEDTFGLII